ncbi:MAG: EamA family transporter [Rickettsiales bacterium]|nr:EamA family transporter [Rickettsiales bacterium]
MQHPSSEPHTARATMIGALAPIAWAMMALLIVLVQPIPPLQLLSLMMTTGAVVALMLAQFRRVSLRVLLGQEKGFYLVGLLGLFGFFTFQFLAFQNAPPMEVFILVNLWPIALLLLTAFVYRHLPNRWHILFSILGLLGVLVVAYLKGFRGFTPNAEFGLFCGFVAAFMWAVYSILNRRYRAVPVDAIFGVFVLVGIVAGMGHFIFEDTIALSSRQWGLVILMGSVPEGLALYAWSHGVQHGDLRTLSTVSYLSPILGALLLALLEI